MTTDAETYARWEPLPDLPEYPCSAVHLRYDGKGLVATVIYAAEPPIECLRIAFGYVEAFKAYEEFSDPWMETTPKLPMIRDAERERWVWPLQQVANSRWIERVLHRNSGIDHQVWRHFVIVTSDMTLHVMTSGDPEAVELTRRR